MEKEQMFTDGLFVYELGSLICLACLIMGVVYVLCKLVFPKSNGKNKSKDNDNDKSEDKDKSKDKNLRRRHRIEYLRSFRKGQCALVFIPMMFLYLIGALYGKLPVYDAVLKALSKTFSAVVMMFDTSFIGALLKDSRIYRFSMFFAFYMVAVNACIFGVSLFVQKLSFTWNSWRRRRLFSRRLCKDTCIVFGNNPHSRTIYQSDLDYGYKRRYIVDNFDFPGEGDLFAEGIKYSSFKGDQRESELLERYLKRLNNRKQARLSIIINFEDDNKNIALAEQFSISIRFQLEQTQKRLSEERKNLNKNKNADNSARIKWEEEVDRISKLSIFVFGSEDLDSIYLDIEKASCGYLYHVNKYRIIGQRFLWEHPFTDFMDEKHVDYTKALLKEKTTISVSMVGFGKPNRRLLLDLISGNQFAIESEKSKDGREPLIAKYYIYDNRRDLHTKDLNHGYFRYDKFCAEHKDDSNYLPFADRPADVHFMSGCDINSEEFYDSLKHSLGRKFTDLNFIFISFGDDYENIELGKKLYAKKKEWGIPNLVFFVKTKRPKTEEMQKLAPKAEQTFIPYGEENEIYSLKKIISRDLYRIAAAADCAYWETSNRQNECARIWDWHSSERDHIDRQSSFYAGLNLKDKYGLLGLRIRDGKVVDSNSPEIEVKLKLEKRKGTLVLEETRGERDIKELPFAQARDNLAYQEHLRWNAFMICNGYVPSSINQILESDPNPNPDKNEKKPKDKGKCHDERRHGNLTTFEGLKEFSSLLSREYHNCDFDVIKYDYDLLDKSISGAIVFSETKEQTDEEYIAIFNNLAILYFETGRLKEAEECFLKVLEIRKKQAKKDPDRYQCAIADTWKKIFTILYNNLGRLEKAVEFDKKAETILKSQRSNDKQKHTDIIHEEGELDMTRKINTYIYSFSEDLKSEARELKDFVNTLKNDISNSYNAVIRPLPKIGEEFKEEDIRDSDMCIFLFGQNVEEETEMILDAVFSITHDSKDNKPKLYMYFKKPKEGEAMDESIERLQEKIDSRYGHYYGGYDNLETIKLRILLNLKFQEMDYLSVDMEEGGLSLSGKKVEDLDIDDVEEFENNDELNKLKAELSEIEEKYFEMKSKLDGGNCSEEEREEFVRVASRRSLLIERIDELRKLIFDLSLGLSKDSVRGDMTPRMKKAYKLFEEGDSKGCLSVLFGNEINDDFTTRRKAMNEEQQKEASLCIREHKVAIKVLMDMNGYQGRFDEIEKRYEKIVPEAKEFEVELDVILDYADYLRDHAKSKEAEIQYLEALEIYCRLAEQDPEQYESGLARTYNNLAVLYEITGRLKEAEEYFLKALEIRKKLAEKDPAQYASDLADTFKNLAILYNDTGRLKEAAELNKKAEAILERQKRDD